MARFIAFICCLVGLQLAVAQSSLGLNVSPGLTFLSNGYDPSPSFSGGVYWDRQLFRALGFSTGLQFTHLTATSRFDILGDPILNPITSNRDRFEILELPLDLRVELGDWQSDKTEVFLVAGYSFGVLLATGRTIFRDNIKEQGRLESLHGLGRDLHFGKFGIEVRHRFGERLAAAMGLQMKYVGIYDQRYGGFSGVNLYLKVGL